LWAMSSTSTEELRIRWLESTLEFTREKIKLEEVLGHLLQQLAETTGRARAEAQRLDRMTGKAEALLASMRSEAAANRRAVEKLTCLNEELEI
jgi:DNA-binding protein H-NS